MCIGSEERDGLGWGEPDGAPRGARHRGRRAHAESADRSHIDADLGGGGSAAQLMRALAAKSGTVHVSAEIVPATVTDITHTRMQVGSSLTSVNQADLTRLELTFAFLLVASAGGLVLAAGPAVEELLWL
ncbi:MAG TPA: hypothetical protein VFM91_07280 [Propionibacteriaceae bacterium]|nr:hypothetical protein [Propionibacteriaceae bacterium]